MQPLRHDPPRRADQHRVVDGAPEQVVVGRGLHVERRREAPQPSPGSALLDQRDVRTVLRDERRRVVHTEPERLDVVDEEAKAHGSGAEHRRQHIAHGR